MKNCPNCKSEVETNFDLCWKCNYSFSEKKTVLIKDENEDKREINCLRCKVRMIYTGEYNFHEGAKFGILGNLFEAFVNREKFDLYLCKRCGKVEFFLPLIKTIN